MAESLLLSLVGGAFGLLAAFGGLRLLANLPEGQLPRMDTISLDGGVLLFTTVISIGVALAFGLLPALHASRQDLSDTMHESSGTTGSPYARRLLSGLVVIEVALALVLLVGAGLMTRSFSKLLQVSPGFDSTNLIAARVLLPATKYQRATQVRFYEDVIERMRRAPGVTNASAVSAMPLHDVGAAGALPFNVEGQQPPPTEDPLADVRIVAPGYFETMKIKLLEGGSDDRLARAVSATPMWRPAPMWCPASWAPKPWRRRLAGPSRSAQAARHPLPHALHTAVNSRLGLTLAGAIGASCRSSNLPVGALLIPPISEIAVAPPPAGFRACSTGWRAAIAMPCGVRL